MRRAIPFLLAGLAACAGQPVTNPSPAESPAAPEARQASAALVDVSIGRPPSSQDPVAGAPDAVYFATGSATILDDRVLAAHAERLQADPRLFVVLVGHTDHHGSRSMNLALAERRTATVAARLRELGVQPRQIRQRAYGHEKARGDCRTESCRSRLRRVDLVYPPLPSSTPPKGRGSQPRK